MIEPRAIAVIRSGYTALESAQLTDHRLFEAVVADLDVAGLCRVLETMLTVVVSLFSDLREADPAFDPDEWLQRLGLVAAGAP
jgi:hypothetical protein